MKRTAITLFAALAFVLGSFAITGSASAQCTGGTYVPYVGNVPCDIVSSADGFINATGDRYDVADADSVTFGGNAVASAPAGVAGNAGSGGGSHGGGGAGGGLAVTGSETTTPVILGAALIAIGGLAVISSKRREIAS